MKKHLLLEKSRLIILSFSLLLVYGSLNAQIFNDLDPGLIDVQFSATEWGDYDNDGDLDVYISGYNDDYNYSKIYRYDSLNGEFTDINAALVSLGSGAAAWGDYDNDGDLDLVITGRNDNDQPQTKIYENIGNDNFVDIKVTLRAVKHSAVEWIDFDNDGDLDLLLAGEDAFLNSMTKLYRNDGNDEFVDTYAGLPGVRSCDIACIDFDADGLTDIAISGNTGSELITKLYKNELDDWTEVVTSMPGLEYSSLEWADFDFDGVPDLYMQGFNGERAVSMIYLNGADGFERMNIAAPGLQKGSVSCADIDNDGDMDMIITGLDNSEAPRTVVMITVSGVLAESGIGLDAVYRSDAQFGDYDKDGDLDLVLSGVNGNGVFVSTVYRNDMTLMNNKPAPPSSMDALVWNNTATLHWDYGDDWETMPEGLSYNVMIGTSKGAIDVISPMSDLESGRRLLPELGNTGYNQFYEIRNLVQGRYYWQVQSIDNGLLGSAFTAIDSFDILGIKTTPSDYEQPLCTGQEIEIPFEVSSDFDTNNVFYAQLSNTKGLFTNPIDIGSLVAYEDGVIIATIPEDIENSKTYKIRVIGSSPYVEGSDNTEFLTIFRRDAPVLQYPVNGSEMVPPNPIVTWQKVDYAEQYEVQFSSTSSSFTLVTEEATVDASDLKYQCEKIDSGMTYWWRARSLFKCGDGIWSEPRMFTTLSLITGTVAVNLDPGDEINVSFVVNNPFADDNTFIAQLSDRFGNFDEPVKIGTLKGSGSGTIKAAIPDDIKYGAGYRVRVVGTSPVVVGRDNGADIQINGELTYDIFTMTPGDVFCAGEPVDIQYVLSNVFETGNVFTAQLSNANGFFNNPVDIGTKESVASGVIKAVIPANMPDGDGYRVRVIGSNPDKTGDDNGVDFRINALPNTEIIGSTRLEINSNENYSVDETEGVGYTWSVTGGEITGADNLASVNVQWGEIRNGTVKLIAEVEETGCMDSSLVAITLYDNFNVSGIVSDKTTVDPIANAKVEFSGGGLNESTFTDANGTFDITLSDDIDYTASAYVPSDADYITQYYNLTQNITEITPIRLDANLMNVDFYLGKGPENNNSISGLVRDEDGKACDAYVILFLIAPDNDGEGIKYESRTYVSNSGNGDFEFTNLHPGSYVLLAVPMDETLVPGYFRTGATASWHWLDATNIHVNVAETKNNNLITLSSILPITGIGSISGQTYTETGSIDKGGDTPLAKKSVSGAMTFTVDENEKVRKYDVSKHGGPYIMPALPPGGHDIRADKVGYEKYNTDVTITEGDPNVEHGINLLAKDPVSVEEFKSNDGNKAFVYPNPSLSGDFNILFNSFATNAKMIIYDVTGNEVYSAEYETNMDYETIKVRGLDLQSGTYLIKMINGNEVYNMRINIAR